MATISGRVIFDRDRSVTFSSGDAGMVNIPVVLQNVGTGARLTVLTDTNGNFIFFNVPNGNYRLVESYGTFGGVPSPGDFSAAIPNGIPVGADPPVTSAVNPPAGTTNLDSVTPNTLLFTVTGADITDRNFFDGPVIYTPIQTILDPCAVISGENLITVADSGTFGSFPQGTPANTGAPVEPYPGVTPDFTYVLPNPSAFTPAGGEYTVQNIMNDAMSTQIGAWWRIADHTSGDETGRMMVVNGFNPGAVFFRSVVQVQPNTNYLFAAWILNLFKVTGYPNPELGVRILDQDGNILYSDTLGAQIPPNVNAPEWKEIGSTLNSRDNTSLTVEFLSEGPEVIGNDYAIDDISFNEIQVPQFIPVKSVDRQSANVGETVRFTVTLTNACTSPLTGVFFQDTLPDGLSFAEGSVTVDGTPEPASNPETGFALPDVPGGATVTVSFDVKVDAVPTPNPTLNSAAVRYLYTPVEGGIPSTFDVRSNEVPVVVAAEADLSVLKTASPDAVSPGDTLTYTLTVSNTGPSPAENVVLTDSTPVFLSGAEFSLDGGLTWNPWITPYTLGSFASGESRTVLLRGTVAPAAVSSIENTASVASSTPDPDLSNNTSTVNTPVNTSADISVVKLGAPKPAIPGELLTYTIAVANAGPSAAENVVLADTVPDALTNVEFSTDNGLSYQTWTGSAALGDLASGIVRTVLLRGRVSAAAAGTIVNTAVVSSDTPDPDPGNNSSTDETAVAVSADVGVMKTGSPSPVTIGDTLTYTVTVTNAGPSDAQDVTLTDTLPAGLTGGEYSLDGGITFQPWTGAATLGTLAAGAFRTVLLRAEVSDTVGETVRNTAVVSATTPDPNPGNNQSTVITPIDTSADLSVTKSGSPNPAVPGEFLIYSITVRNAGPDASLNTVLTDTLPSELSGAEYSVDGGNTWSPWAGSFAIGTLAAGGVRTVFLRGVLDAAASGILTNTATVSSDTPDPDPGNNETTVLVPVGVSADLTVRKSALPVPVEAGGVLTYTIVVTNAGPSTAQDVTLTDAVPPVIENPEFRVQGGTVFSPWVSPYVIGELAAGETFTITIRGTVNPATPRGTILNTAVVSSSTPDPDPTDNTDTIETPVIPSADLAVEKTGAPNPAVPGETLQYTISITNAGPSDAQNAVLLDATPAVFLNPEYSTDGGTTWNPWITPLNLGTLVAGASRTVLLRGTLSPFATDTITNTAVVEALTPDPNPDNNTDTALTPIQPSADLSILKTASPSPVLVGGRIEYLLTVSNAGPSPAENTVVTDILPTGLTDAEISTDNGMTWLPFDGTASVGTLAVGGSIQLLLRARVPASTAESLVNTAIVASDTPDPNPDNNTFTVDTPVLLSADLAMVKTAASATVTPGGTLAYVLTISNAGPADAQNVMVFDTPPAELFDVEYSLDGGGTWLPWAGTLIWGTLPAGAAETILLRGTVAFSASGVLENTAVVSSDTPDPNPVNNTDTSTTIVEAEAEADVGITKSTLAAQAVPGENLTYTILVANAGPDAAEDVTLYDALPSELLDGMFSTDNGVTWQVWRSPYVLGTLEAGEIVTLLLRGTVSDAACGSLANTAVVSSSTPDPNPENNTATVEIPVLPPVLGGADLAVQKTAFPNPVCCGQCITFTLTVVNAGPMTAENTVLTDTLPMGLCGAIYSVDFGRTWSPWTGVYEAGNLAAGETVTVLLRANVGACAGCCVVNIASVSSSTTDPFLDNNIAHTAVVVCECRCREKSDGCNNKRFSTDNGV